MRRRALVAAALALAFLAPAGAQSKIPPSAWWPLQNREWQFQGKLTTEGVTKAVKFELRTKEKDKEKIGTRDATPLQWSNGPRVIATEWYAYDEQKVLLLKHSSGGDTARTLDPPQLFLDADKLVEGGTWSWQAKDGGETVECRFVGPAKLKVEGAADRECVVVEMTTRFGKDTKVVHEQVRTLWLERGVGLVRERSKTRSPGESGATIETEVETDLVKVVTPEKPENK